MARFAVIAEFRVSEGRLDEFLAAAEDDAAHSVRDEEGCLQFDILADEASSDRVVFYEVYESRAAFDRHLETPHLARFRESLARGFAEELPVRFLARCFPE